MASESESQAFQKRMKDGRYQFTEEEKRVLQECRSESFWYRAFPLAVFGGASTQVLIQRGFLTPSARFGSIPKVIFGTLCGYITGKMLYVPQCRQKFLKLENSPFGDMVRRGGGRMAGAGFGGMEMPGTGFSGESTADGDPQGGPALQQDAPWSGGYDQQVNMDIDTSQAGNYESDLQLRDDNQDHKREMTMTYDELRKRSRERNAQNYTQVLPGHYQPRQAPPPQSGLGQMADQRNDRPSQRAPPQDEFQLGARNRNRMVNKYGDSWEKE